MSRKGNSLQHELILRVLPQIKNNKTGTAYKSRIKDFASWAKSNGYRQPEDLTRETVQEYERYLEQSFGPATIHTYLAPVCAAVGVKMQEIKKPRRTAGTIKRGRGYDATGAKVEKNKQGKKQEEDPRFARLVTLQRAVGIRRAELGKLVGADLVRKGNSWYVHVRRGKGGKEQLQYILPKDVATVRKIFEGVGPDQRVFSDKEMRNKINLHGLRAKHSKDCYQHYADLFACHPDLADKYRALLLRRWEEGHEKLKVANPRAWATQRKRFVSDMDDRPYLLRGDNLKKARALRLPDRYNRLALMCVSVLHLSHWRLDVTTTNYLLQ